MKWIQYCTVIFTSPSLLIFQVNFVKLQLTTTNRGQTLKRQLYTRAGCCLPSQTESYLLLPEGTDFHTSTSLLLERGCPLEYQHQRHIGRGWTCPWSDPSLWELVHHREKNQGVQGETQQKAQQKFGRWTKLKTLVGCHSHWQHPTGKQSKRSGFDQENTGRSGSCRGTNTVVSLSGVTSGTDKEKSKKEYRCWASGRASLHFHSSKNLSIHGTARKKQIRKSCVFQEWITDRKEVREFKSKWIECFCFSHKTHSKACIHFQLLHLHTFHRNFRGHGRRLGSSVSREASGCLDRPEGCSHRSERCLIHPSISNETLSDTNELTTFQHWVTVLFRKYKDFQVPLPHPQLLKSHHALSVTSWGVAINSNSSAW